METSKMHWEELLSTKRLGMENYHNEKKDNRSEFQRDYDRLIFSAAFRRLQNKTQVFPLPGSIFVHNRLTHSLEVASVGRSIANGIIHIKQEKGEKIPKHFTEIGSIVSAACLAHDMGNPPFGHSGENAINTYFSEEQGTRFENQMNPSEWADLINFEGNANAFRLLTNQFQGRRNGGFALTYSMLASIVKYPYEAQYCTQGKQKFGFFQSEKTTYTRIAESLGIITDPNNPNRFARHPLVYMVEAADDICYQIMDIEDAFKLKIINKATTIDLLLGYFEKKSQQNILDTMKHVDDVNEQIAYLRSRVVGTLIEACSQTFIQNEEAILKGTFHGSLIQNIETKLFNAYKNCTKTAFEHIYCSQEVVDIELAGYRIMTSLLDELTRAVMHPKRTFSSKLLARVPSQYNIHAENTYQRIQAIVDFVSGMTDIYALDLYQKISGMNLPTL